MMPESAATNDLFIPKTAINMANIHKNVRKMEKLFEIE